MNLKCHMVCSASINVSSCHFLYIFTNTQFFPMWGGWWCVKFACGSWYVVFDIVRFLIGPIFVIVAFSVWPKYMRAKIVNAVDNSIMFLAQAFLLVSMKFNSLLLFSKYIIHPCMPYLSIGIAFQSKHSKYTIDTAPKSKRIMIYLTDLLGGNVEGCLEEMCFEMSFKCLECLWITSGIVKRIDGWCTVLESTRSEMLHSYFTPLA